MLTGSMPVRLAKRSIALCLFLVIVPNCGPKHPIPERESAMFNSTMVAGQGEKTFAQKYGLNINLPLSEVQFLRLLHQLHLHYEMCGVRGVGAGLPPPRHETSIDLSGAQRCYEIDGDRDTSKGTAEAWRAFANQQHQIFYIETAYAYTGP